MSEETLAPGTVIDGKYRIVGRLGEGGMGIVYHAEHVLMKKRVALKRLHPHLSAIEQVVQRFEREAQAAARIDHPNVCLVTDCGQDQTGGFFIVMELLDGTSLQDDLEVNGPLPMPRLLKIAIQICKALDRAHSMGIVHRDLKPDNIMLVEREGEVDQVKIMDFGIAKMITSDTGGKALTQAGMIFGTPHYLSPEQASGDPVDHRGDLYSLGVILFELTTGRRPFDAPTAAALLRKHVTEDPPLMEQVAPRALPPGFQQLVSRLLAKAPEDRYPSAKVCIDHLQEILEQPFEDEQDSITTSADLTTEATTAEEFPDDAPDALPPSSSYNLESTSIPSVSSIEASAEQNISKLWQGGGWKRWALLGVALAATGSIIIVVLALTLLRPGPGDEEDSDAHSTEQALLILELQRTEMGENPAVKEALTLSVKGKTQEAIRILEGLGDDPELGDSPHRHYHLAVMHSNEEELEAALDAADRCMELEHGYTADPILVGILVQGLHARDTMRRAADIMTTHGGEAIALRAATIAREEKNTRIRRTALSVIREGNLMHHLEPWMWSAAQLLDPSTQITCKNREKLLGELTKTGDSRALASLALLKESKGLADQKGSCWDSIQKEWQSAVDTLKDRKPPGNEP